ncbi:unnamed protein product [Litomosoides sigmodontis]|uniref:Uncharacterized protein n=1 Tax=Litomosoides sigmodontis TaxID=42156 RepID=A0A3P7M7F8_LITSI|nr:unnamed protein product [Litomosoides sigmodontis]
MTTSIIVINDSLDRVVQPVVDSCQEVKMMVAVDSLAEMYDDMVIPVADMDKLRRQFRMRPVQTDEIAAEDSVSGDFLVPVIGVFGCVIKVIFEYHDKINYMEVDQFRLG